MTYLLFKALHIFFMLVWMAGMLALPQLFVRHTRAATGSEHELMLQEMERKLLRLVVNPAMILALVFGIALVVSNMDWLKQGWLHAKLLLVLVMGGLHGLMAKARKDFARDDNTRPAGFFQIINLIVLLSTALIIALATIKPF